MAARKNTTKTVSIVPAIADGAKDWTYLADKEPTNLHYELAAWIEAQTGVKIDPKAAQLVAVLRIPFQKSESNKTRDDYRGLDEAIVAKRSEHMVEAHVEAKELIAARKAAEAAAEAAKAAKPVRRTRKPAAPKAA